MRFKNKFNEVIMQRGYSIPFQVRAILQHRKNWKEGLTIQRLTILVKHEIVRWARDNSKKLKKEQIPIIKKKKVSCQTIYRAISQINLYSLPRFYIMSCSGTTETGKIEHRYFVPKEEDDVNHELRKVINRKERAYLRENNLNEFVENQKNEEEIFESLTTHRNR